MSILITRPGKHALYLENPVMPAAGSFGFGSEYLGLIAYEKLGAIVTHPVSVAPMSPAHGPRIVPLPAGLLAHTGLPNAGLSAILKEQRQFWASLPVPLIVHLMGRVDDALDKAGELLEREESVAAVELGLHDDSSALEVTQLTRQLVQHCQKPVLVRLPLQEAQGALTMARAAVEGGASALVAAAPPRGIARDPRSGQLVEGRIYGPLVKPQALRMVQHLVAAIGQQLPADLPIIGCGGIHTPQDARDFLEMGAVAVQVDSVTWVQPRMLERIARDLAGNLVTRVSGAFPDEWNPDMGQTEHEARKKRDERPAKRDR